MTRVISSPSISTIVFFVLIFVVMAYPFRVPYLPACCFCSDRTPPARMICFCRSLRPVPLRWLFPG